MILFRSSGNSRLMTNPGEDYSNEDASAWLASVAWLDVFIKPLRGLSQRGKSMSFTARHPDHRHHKKNERCDLEQGTAQRTICERADSAKEGMDY